MCLIDTGGDDGLGRDGGGGVEVWGWVGWGGGGGTKVLTNHSLPAFVVVVCFLFLIFVCCGGDQLACTKSALLRPRLSPQWLSQLTS